MTVKFLLSNSLIIFYLLYRFQEGLVDNNCIFEYLRDWERVINNNPELKICVLCYEDMQVIICIICISLTINVIICMICISLTINVIICIICTSLTINVIICMICISLTINVIICIICISLTINVKYCLFINSFCLMLYNVNQKETFLSYSKVKGHENESSWYYFKKMTC